MASIVDSGLIGKPVPRKEDARLLRGRGCYVDDIVEPPGTLHVAFVLSTRAHARIVSIDAGEARKLEGIVAVFTGEHFKDGIRPLMPDIQQPGFQSVARSAMPVDRVRFVGEAIAVVVAQSRYIAEDGADLVRVEYEDLPVLSTLEAAIAEDAIKLHENTKDNVLFRASYRTEGFTEAFAGAHLVVRDTFYSPRISALSLEPRGCLAVYDWGLENLTFYTSTQIPHIVRTGISEALNWDETKLRVIAPDVGGGFGMKAYLYPEELIVAFLARVLNAPVKWVCDRREDLLSSVQGRGYRFDIALAFTADGQLIGTKADFYATSAPTPVILSARRRALVVRQSICQDRTA